MLYDVLVIGGGINGCGCAADAALRGLSVLLCEQDDLASKTSSKSSKLIHGGLRYLELFDLRMVKQALDEQAVLLQIAPHLVKPLPFILPYHKKRRSAWLLRAGLFLYDHLSRVNPLPNSKTLNRQSDPQYFSPLQQDQGFLFYDAQTEDARLTIAVALHAKEHGATILTRTKVIGATAKNDQWVVTLQPAQGPAFQVTTKTLINASGPWVQETAATLGLNLKQPLSFVKGSHIVVKPLYTGTHAYLLQAKDKRVVFVIPYQGYSLIGTTDVVIDDINIPQQISPAELTYLSTIVKEYFSKPLNPDEIITTWSGIRVLCNKPGKAAAKLSRDYCLELTLNPAPVLTIIGGKITAYRQLAAEVIDKLWSKGPPSTTNTAMLPGGLWGDQSLSDYISYAQRQYSWLEPSILSHYLNSYGSRTEHILAKCTHVQDLGLAFGPLLYQKEVDYLIREEWAQTSEDILWRRTKLGLSIEKHDQEALENYLRTGLS